MRCVTGLNKKIRDKLKKIELISSFYHKIRQSYFKHFFSDMSFVKRYYKKNIGKELNLMEPADFSEKLQWLKLYWFNPSAKHCADKYEVRNIISQKIGDNILNEIYFVYDSVNEIDLSKLPNSFVMKATHSSGYNFVCKDKSKVDWDSQLKELNRWLKIDYFWHTREWVYKDIKPRIICERFLFEDESSSSLTDYKIYCFNGKPMYCQVIKDRGLSGGTIDFFNTEWERMEFSGLKKMPHSEKVIKKPDKYKEMIEISKILSEKFPFVRVDFYYVNRKIYFGELTFFPQSGFGEFYPTEWNKIMGDLLKLPTVHTNNISYH